MVSPPACKEKTGKDRVRESTHALKCGTMFERDSVTDKKPRVCLTECEVHTVLQLFATEFPEPGRQS